MVVNNKVDTLTYDVEAAQHRVSGASAAPAPSPPPHQRGPFMMAELHKVAAPERRSTARALEQRLAEIFFPDDPLHQFKNQSFARKLVLALQYFFPIFDWGSHYSLKLLRSDAIAGLTIASLAIPQVIPSITPPCFCAAFNSPPIFSTFLFRPPVTCPLPWH
jgi:sulfate transporter 3